MIDERFLGRVYKMSAFVLAVTVAALVAYRVSASFIWGVVVGYAVALGSLALLDIVVNRALIPGRSVGKAKWAVAAVLKYAAIAVVIYAVVETKYMDVVGFVVGLGIIQAVIVLKALGATLTQGPFRHNRPAGSE